MRSSQEKREMLRNESIYPHFLQAPCWHMGFVFLQEYIYFFMVTYLKVTKLYEILK